MIHLRVCVSNGDVFECDHKATTFKAAVEDIFTHPLLCFSDVAVNVGHIVSIENVGSDDRIERLPEGGNPGNKGCIS